MSKLVAALSSVNWEKNSQWLSGQLPSADRIEACNFRIAMWAKQFEKIETGEPALTFVREMQHAGHHTACCLGLALYKPAAGSMRAMLECAMYFCFFRTHPAELQTLVRDDNYFVSKKEITDYFKRHVVEYQAKQSKLNFASRLDLWYSRTSAVVHGQIPGVWSHGDSVSSFVHDAAMMEAAITHLEEGSLLIRDLFLCTVAADIWHGVSTTAKKTLLAGLAPGVRAVLKLDAA